MLRAAVVVGPVQGWPYPLLRSAVWFAASSYWRMMSAMTPAQPPWA